jgi:hypothetical protein
VAVVHTEASQRPPARRGCPLAPPPIHPSRILTTIRLSRAEENMIIPCQRFFVYVASGNQAIDNPLAAPSCCADPRCGDARGAATRAAAMCGMAMCGMAMCGMAMCGMATCAVCGDVCSTTSALGTAMQYGVARGVAAAGFAMRAAARSAGGHRRRGPLSCERACGTRSPPRSGHRRPPRRSGPRPNREGRSIQRTLAGLPLQPLLRPRLRPPHAPRSSWS